MAGAKKLEQNGAVSLSDCGGSCDVKSATFALPINLCQYPGTQTFQQCRSISSPSEFVDLLTGTGIATLRYVLLRVEGGTLEVRFTSPAGVDQLVTLSDLIILSSPTAMSGLTALAVRGTATLSLLLAGDAS